EELRISSGNKPVAHVGKHLGGIRGSIPRNIGRHPITTAQIPGQAQLTRRREEVPCGKRLQLVRSSCRPRMELLIDRASRIHRSGDAVTCQRPRILVSAGWIWKHANYVVNDAGRVARLDDRPKETVSGIARCLVSIQKRSAS